MSTIERAEEGRGPSWWDVGRLVDEVQRRTGRVVRFEVAPVRYANTPPGVWHVRVIQLDGGREVVGAACGGYQFKGNAGAATMSAAFYMAVLRLNGKLDEVEERARQAAMF